MLRSTFNQEFLPIVNEHDKVKKMLSQLEDEVQRLTELKTSLQLQRVSVMLQQFMSILHSYSAMESIKLYPMMARLTGGQVGPISVLTQTVVMADRYAQQFFERLENIESESDMADLISYAQQICFIYEQTLLTEEEYIFPIAERMDWHTSTNDVTEGG